MTARIKVIGERNTGTNLTSRLVATYTDAELVRSTAPTAVAVAARLTRSESLIDAWFAGIGNRAGGWKHAHGDLVAEQLRRRGLGSVGVIVVVRDPWAWLPALHRRPYHVGFIDDFEDFLGRPLPIRRRESRDRRPRTPVELWNWKAAGYRSLAATHPGTAIVRYEDLIVDCATAFGATCATLGVEARPATLPAFGVKRGDADKPVADYVVQLAEAHHRRWYRVPTRTLVRDELDVELVEWFGYDASPTWE